MVAGFPTMSTNTNTTLTFASITDHYQNKCTKEHLWNTSAPSALGYCLLTSNCAAGSAISTGKGEATGASGFAVGTLVPEAVGTTHLMGQLDANGPVEVMGATGSAIDSRPATANQFSLSGLRNGSMSNSSTNGQNQTHNSVSPSLVEMSEASTPRFEISITMRELRNYMGTANQARLILEISKCLKITSILSTIIEETAATCKLRVTTDQFVSVDTIRSAWPSDGFNATETGGPTNITVVTLPTQEKKTSPSEQTPLNTNRQLKGRILDCSTVNSHSEKSSLQSDTSSNTSTPLNQISPRKRSLSEESPRKPTRDAYKSRDNERSNFAKLDKAYEEAYPRKSYSLYLYGTGILKHKKGFNERVKHISSIKGIREVDCAELQHNEETGETRIKVIVSNYNDYKKLLQPWPSYSFGSGVKPETMAVDGVYLFITDVETNMVVDQNRKMFRDCEAIYGLTGFERVTKKDGTKTKLIKCQPKTLFNLVDVLRYNIHLDPKKRIVKPCINHANVCQVCLSHSHKKCEKVTRCAQCAELGHSVEACPNLGVLKCFNCLCTNKTNLEHRADRDDCPLLANKTIALNKWLINLMLGEGLIKSEYDICKSARVEDENASERDLVKIVQAEIHKTKLQDKAELDQRLLKHDLEIAALTNKVENVTQVTTKLMEDVTRLDAAVGEVKGDIAEVKANLANVKTVMTSNHNEVVNLHASSQQNVNENFSLLFNMLKLPSKERQKRSSKPLNI
jgi:hypothetical protein